MMRRHNGEKHVLRKNVNCTGSLLILGTSGFAVLLAIVLASCAKSDALETIFSAGTGDRDRIVRAGAADLVVLFSGSTRGNFEPCGCGGVYDGGFSRRATVIDEYRRLNRNTVLVDTGDMTFHTAGSTPRLKYISQSYHYLKYDAILLGWGELRGGIDKLDPYAKKYDLPLLASNVRPTTPSHVREVIELKRNGMNIAIIGVIAKRYWSRLRDRVRNQLTFEDPVKTIQRLTEKLKADHDVIILLSYLSPADRETIKDKLSGITMWIDSGTRRYDRRASANKGDGGVKNIILDSTPPRFICWHNDRRIGVVGLKSARPAPEITFAELFKIAKDIRQVEKHLELYDAYKYAARQAIIPRLVAAAGRRRVKLTYTAADKCQYCHHKQYQWWAKTEHAHAFGTLVKVRRDDDPNCWACHTTGLDEPTGFSSPETSPDLMHVSCQVCHRIDPATHPQQKPLRPGGYNITRDFHCRRCHVPHRSPQYNYKKYIKQITCPKIERSAGTKPATRPGNK